VMLNAGGYFLSDPPEASIDELARYLQNNQVQSVYVNYSDGYRLAFKTNELVKPYIISKGHQTGNNRISSYVFHVRSDRSPAYIFRDPNVSGRFEEYLHENDVAYRRDRIGSAIVFQDLEPPIWHQLLHL